ncbi:Coenzyme F420 hydrogenase/dehydrogenase, beta subunit C-terminal domain [Parabacteroides sp. PF5-6]|uniref:Coenzyme F420 hydrogenase/dehydrogenase, beta subunit C-terminal domain n=1 Tax=Parabacteroides sp. PF5-6 TaxID=1742403 RepID=UPI0024064474|nr:Coenzyme F420 hydrogenase/dehydrogenase, beta subunit C-terminal domain [Parabacteroides sp. PF5-6]MDF9831732.1 NAD-dependent dihydropyrimidine dehydrogenase PreA subunit [Parabacteroides sp. PF5-6]
MIQLKDKKDCCGCYACVQKCPVQCIVMEEDEEGFFYPTIDLKQCIDCGLCEKVCPVIHQGKERRPDIIYAAKNRDNSIREESSSGGVFTLLAKAVISQGGVVFGVRFDEQWKVRHDWIDNEEDIAFFRGSKYVQSDVSDHFRQAEQFLKQGRQVLFSGTPCQISGLKLYLRKEYENLLAIDFICHGVPSPKVWEQYLHEFLKKRGISKKNVYSVLFRDKIFGWKTYSFTCKYAKTPRGYERRVSEPFYKNSFIKGFLADLYLRPSCYDCPSKCFKSGSDMTIADYWGIDDVLPEFNDDRGVSLLFIHNPDTTFLLKEEYLELKSTTYEQAVRKNRSTEKPAALPSERDAFFSMLKNRSAMETIDHFTRIPFGKRVKSKIKSLFRLILKQ